MELEKEFHEKKFQSLEEELRNIQSALQETRNVLIEERRKYATLCTKVSTLIGVLETDHPEVISERSQTIQGISELVGWTA